jgi:hypothetical protein
MTVANLNRLTLSSHDTLLSRSMRGGCHRQSFHKSQCSLKSFLSPFSEIGSDKLFKSSRSAIYLQQRIKKIITEYTDIKGVNTQKSKLIAVLGESGESELSCVSTADVALYRTVWYDQY